MINPLIFFLLSLVYLQSCEHVKIASRKFCCCWQGLLLYGGHQHCVSQGLCILQLQTALQLSHILLGMKDSF